ncbi:MAG TPA: fatty acid hydroxylase family protein [Polyangia bacterium]
MIPEKVATFRAQLRDKYISSRYSGVAHFVFTSIASLSVVLYCAATVRAPHWWELVTVPATFLFANFVEYRAHRGVMHHRIPPFSLVFERHTPSHHGFYTHEAMAAESSRDYYMVLFPPILIVFFFGLFALPVGLALAWLATANIARMFVATAVGYFLTYEWLHFSYHQPPDGFIGRLWLVRRLRAHHTLHHDIARMQKWNFNITFPICDTLFGTTFEGED